jgi:hypothetical protein
MRDKSKLRKLTQPLLDVGSGDTRSRNGSRPLWWRVPTVAVALLVGFGLVPFALLWDSPDMLWYTRGTEVRGPAAVVEQLHGYYAGTWHLEPDMTKFRATVLGERTVQLLVPVVFTRGAPGEPPQKNEFLICQTLVRGANGWQVASILPIANTQLQKPK